MPGPYDYTINIPQPPANNFLQSLLGIQQLKGLQQQSQISAQQADIQQQQARFAAEMQPLEREKLQASIAAVKANTAQSAASRDVAMEGLRQSRITFGREEALNKEADALRADMMKLSTDPTSATREKLLDLSYRAAAFAPKSYEPLQKMLKDYPRTGKMLENTASDVVFSVQSGQPNVASGSVDKTIEAAQATLKANPDDKDAQAALTLLKPVQTLMQEEKYGEAMITASNFLRNVYPERWDAVTKDMKEVGGIAKIQAETEEAKAKTKKAFGEIPGQEKSLPSAILRDNVAIEKKVTAANEMADKLSQAAEAMRSLPSVGSAKEWWTNVKPKLGFGENPEIAVRSNAAQLAGLGMLGAESSAMGGAIRSNVQFQYATSKLPDSWSAPQEVAKRLDAQAEVQRKLAQIMTIDAEWNSAFRGSQKATKNEQILGMDVAPGTTKAQFKEMAAKALFPPKGEESATPKPTKTDQITGTPDLQSLLNKYR